jgi:hypothetical protein
LAEPNRTPSRGQKGHNQPITRHPLFPAIVALWFCALLGLGSLTVSAPALEGLVLATHIDALVPAAAPPLGMTARLVVALALAVVGGGIGWLLALRVAAPEVEPEPHVFKFSDLGDELQWPGSTDQPATVDEPEAPDPEPEIAPAPEPERSAQAVISASLNALSQAELLERLAIALQRRQESPTDAAAPSDPVIHFPDLAVRQGSRGSPLPPASGPGSDETEKALRDALARLQRMSGGT